MMYRHPRSWTQVRKDLTTFWCNFHRRGEWEVGVHFLGFPAGLWLCKEKRQITGGLAS